MIGPKKLGLLRGRVRDGTASEQEIALVLEAERSRSAEEIAQDERLERERREAREAAQKAKWLEEIKRQRAELDRLGPPLSAATRALEERAHQALKALDALGALTVR